MKMTTVTTEWREMAIGVVTSKDETLTIKAQVFGCFAVHSGWNKHFDTWTITHVPTGRLIERYPGTRFEVGAVKAIAAKMHARYADAWNTESQRKAQLLMTNCADIWNVTDEVAA
jgi:hypothetical protein